MSERIRMQTHRPRARLERTLGIRDVFFAGRSSFVGLDAETTVGVGDTARGEGGAGGGGCGGEGAVDEDAGVCGGGWGGRRSGSG